MNPRHPDITGIVQYGVVCTGGKSKIAEHGGDNPQNRDVPIRPAIGTRCTTRGTVRARLFFNVST